MTTFNKYLLKLEDLSGPRSTEIIRNLTTSQVLSEFKATPDIDQTKLIGIDKTEFERSIKSDDYTKIIGLTEKTKGGIDNLEKVISTLQDLGEKFKERNKVDITGPNPGLFGTNDLSYTKSEEDDDIGKTILDILQKSGVDMSEIKKLKDGAVKLSLASFISYPYVDLASHSIGSPIDFALFMNSYILSSTSTQTRSIKNNPEAKFIINLLDAYKIDFEDFTAKVPVIDNVSIKVEKINLKMGLFKENGSDKRKFTIVNDGSGIKNLFTKNFEMGSLKDFYDERYKIEEGHKYADIQIMAMYYLCFNKFYKELEKILLAISELAESKNDKIKEIIKQTFKKAIKSLRKYIDGCFKVYYKIDGKLGSFKDEHGLPFKVQKDDTILYVKEEKFDKIEYEPVKFSEIGNLLILEDKGKTAKNLINFFTSLNNYKICKDPLSGENIYMGGLIQKTDYISSCSEMLYKYFNLLLNSKKEMLKIVDFKERLLSNSLVAKDLVAIRDKIENAIREIDLKTTPTEKTLECQKQVNNLTSFFVGFTEKELTSRDKLETKILSNKLIKEIDIIEEKEKDTDGALNYLKQQNRLKQEAMYLMIPTIWNYMNSDSRRVMGRDLNLGCAFKDMLMSELKKKQMELQRIHQKELEPKLLAIKKEGRANDNKYRNALKQTHSSISSLTPAGVGITNSTIIRLKPEGKREIASRAFWERVLALFGRTIYVVLYSDDFDPKNGDQYHTYFDLINAAILADNPDEIPKKCFMNVLRGRKEFIKEIGERGSIMVCNRKDNLGDSKEWVQMPIEPIILNIDKSDKYSKPIFVRYMIYNILANNMYFQRLAIAKWGDSKESIAKKVLLKTCYDQARASGFKLSDCQYITCREQVAYALSANMGAISSNYNLDFSSGQSLAVADPALTKTVEKQILLKQYGGEKKKKRVVKNKKVK
jgi:hypothetical protein